MKRSWIRNGAGAKRRGHSSFPKQRDAKFCRFVIEETNCVGLGVEFRERVALYDVQQAPRRWRHRCWGPYDPAHVGKHRAQGAPDFGHVVNMCRALHDFYDQHRSAFAKMTGLTERKLESAASGYALKYVELGNAPPERETPE